MHRHHDREGPAAVERQRCDHPCSTELLLGIAEFVLGVWAVRSWERSLFTLVTLVGVWAIFHGVSQIFGAFTLKDAGKLAGRVEG
jgi:uncharacterized membrane protein HdeD (DUF308 family)